MRVIMSLLRSDSHLHPSSNLHCVLQPIRCIILLLIIIGTDGPTDAAGAVVDGTTISRIESFNNGKVKGSDALKRHDAYTFLDSSPHNDNNSEQNEGDDKETIDTSNSPLSFPLIKTGPTGTNVADVCITLVR